MRRLIIILSSGLICLALSDLKKAVKTLVNMNYAKLKKISIHLNLHAIANRNVAPIILFVAELVQVVDCYAAQNGRKHGKMINLQTTVTPMKRQYERLSPMRRKHFSAGFSRGPMFHILSSHYQKRKNAKNLINGLRRTIGLGMK